MVYRNAEKTLVEYPVHISGMLQDEVVKISCTSNPNHEFIPPRLKHSIEQIMLQVINKVEEFGTEQVKRVEGELGLNEVANFASYSDCGFDGIL